MLATRVASGGGLLLLRSPDPGRRVAPDRKCDEFGHASFMIHVLFLHVH